MQNPQSVHAGDLLEIRRSRWRVLDVRAYERCQLIAVAGVGPDNAAVERRFIAPFEAIAPLNRERAPRFVRPRRWRHACRQLLATCTPSGGLRAAAGARIELLPHQLEPALAVVRGRGSRVLLADDVGLGKTIQAGLIIAELQARGQADRVLIVTPAGLRDQWRTELAGRFGIDAAVVDVREIRRRLLTVPVGLNPWLTTPRAIASIDYVKRREVLHSVRACHWDVVVVDEAHGVGRDSDRLAAVSALAARAAFVVLLTATPHNGDPRAFVSLCGVGGHGGGRGDPLLVFRRTKAEVSLGAHRRVRRLHVRVSAAESRMHSLLGAFTRVVRSEHEFGDAWLALSVLYKRACSSARSLELTVRRRLDALGPESVGGLRQLALPLMDLGGELDDTDVPPDCLAAVGLSDRRRERRLLTALREAAQQATKGETKVSALRRLLGRVAEPIVVFTEFRDTLLHLRETLGEPVLVLHGGLTREERQRALDDFLHERCRILLATDAAGEGLNLHHRCRLVVNLELPWNPIRLEQRIGRVDRIGQMRTVHAIHLVARGTAETRVLDRLKARIARAQEEIAAANPVEDVERSIARRVIERNDQGLLSVAAHESNRGPARCADEARRPGTERLMVDLRAEARGEVARLVAARRLSSRAAERALAALDASGPWVTRARLRRTRTQLGRRAIALVRIDYEDGGGHLIDCSLVPISLALTDHERHGAAQVKAILRALGTELCRAAMEASRRDRAQAGDSSDALVSVRLARERQMAQDGIGVERDGFQPGLFDRRAEQADLTDCIEEREIADEFRERVRMLERRGFVAPRPARLLLVLVP
jgi:superfamily II DNA or RNA helicase